MRDMRGRGYGRQKLKRQTVYGDYISEGLAVQIVICVMILGAVWLARVFSPNAASVLRQETARILGNEQYSVSAQAAAGFIKDGIYGIIERFYPDIAGTPAGGKPPDGDIEASYGSGSGGWLPVGMLGNEEKLSPPANALFSPIIVTAPAKAPLSGRITSGFGYRIHPVTGESDFHTGIDIAAPTGTSVTAVFPGYVEEVKSSSIYGNVIVLLHSGGLKTIYSHCDMILAGVGIYVRQGERIALVGSTGISTGPHLHFEIQLNGVYADPMWIFDKEMFLL